MTESSAEKQKRQVQRWTLDKKFQKGGWWIGAHYSPYEGRWCINIVPCLTICVIHPGGYRPRKD